MIAIGLLALLLTACGGHRTRTQATQDEHGAALFEQACAGCHTLDNASGNRSGGDLAQTVLPIADLISFERIMPVKLTPNQIDTVARYVHAIETEASKRPG